MRPSDHLYHLYHVIIILMLIYLTLIVYMHMSSHHTESVIWDKLNNIERKVTAIEDILTDPDNEIEFIN